MNKIKFDGVTMIVILVVIFLAFILIRKHFISARKRIIELEKELQKELEKLKISKERQQEIAQKAVSTYQMVLGFAFLTFCLIIGISIWFGMSFPDALEVNLGTVGFILAVISVIGFDSWNPDKLLEALKEKIKIRTYRKYDFDPNEIQLIQVRVDALNDQLKKERDNLLSDGMTMKINVS